MLTAKQRAFMGKPPPPGYIPGLGRGATGFTTRSDIGPASTAVMAPAESIADKRKAQGEGDGDGKEDKEEKTGSDNEDEAGLLSGGPYEADDQEADAIYAGVDAKMDERRKKRREEREKEELAKYRELRPKIQQQFADLKRELTDVSEEEWAAIPEIGDRGIKRQKRLERYTPLPDSVLAKVRSESEMVTTLDANQATLSGLATPAGSQLADLTQIGEARGAVLGVKLDQMADSVSGQTVVDPKGYLTDLKSMVLKTDAEIGDIKKGRLLLKSVITTNPKHPPGWIAAARLEEVAGKMAAAREIIAQGCIECPKSEDVWLESSRLNTPENAKIILANAVKQIPNSVKIWLRAAELEKDVKSQKKVLRRSLELIPNSYRLWKAAVQLEEDPEDARVMLSRAVECIPDNVELWLTLARLESYENARKVLNEARKNCPGSHEIWIAAAELEEANQNHEMVDVIIKRGVDTLNAAGVNIKREQWLKEAESAERDKFITTCQAITRHTVGLGVEEADRKVTWMEDAESAMAKGFIETARAIFAHALAVFPQKKSIWIRAAFLEKNHGTRQSLEELLQRAVKYCPQEETLWLMAAKEKWLAGEVDQARAILNDAFKVIGDSEQIWLAAVKLESENNEYVRARVLLQKARDRAGTPRVWMKSASLERQLGNIDEARTILEQARAKFPTLDKLWMMSGQVEETAKNPNKAREMYTQGIKECPTSVPLWILAARLEESEGTLVKARSILEKARSRNPKNPLLWLEAIKIETRSNNPQMAKALSAKAMQENPNSGILWSEAIFMEPRPQRRSKSVDALKKCDNDVYVVIAVARLFWAERHVDKARAWFNKAVKLDPDNGDAWAYFLKFEIQQGNEAARDEIVKRCVAADPHHGVVWPTVSKAVENMGKSTTQILTLVTSKLEV